MLRTRTVPMATTTSRTAPIAATMIPKTIALATSCRGRMALDRTRPISISSWSVALTGHSDESGDGLGPPSSCMMVIAGDYPSARPGNPKGRWQGSGRHLEGEADGARARVRPDGGAEIGHQDRVTRDHLADQVQELVQVPRLAVDHSHLLHREVVAELVHEVVQ